MEKFFKVIEGAKPLDDLSGLRLPWVQTQEDLNRAEADNIRIAARNYLTGRLGTPLKWFTPTALLKMHEKMFGEIWEWAIPAALAQLCDDIQAWLLQDMDMSLEEQTARLHHRLAWIHPFENGNGRFARLASDRFMRDRGSHHPEWPRDLMRSGKSRRRYLQALREADQGNYDLLMEFMADHSPG